MRELRTGLWHWEAPHPDWTPDERWPQVVSSYAIDDGARLLLFDPQSVPAELLELAGEREPVVVLTAPWHERDAQSLVERLGAPVFTPPPDTADDLVQKFGITLEQEEVVERLRPCSPCRSRSSSRRTVHQQTVPRSSARSRSPRN